MGYRWGRALGALVMVAVLVPAGASRAAAGDDVGRSARIAVSELTGPGELFAPQRINDRGQILGVRRGGDGSGVVLYERGRIRSLLALAPDEYLLNGWLNERGDVAVTVFRVDLTGGTGIRSTPYLWSGGRPVALGVTDSAAVMAMNERGQLLLRIDDPVTEDGPSFGVWDRGHLTLAPRPENMYLWLSTLSASGVAGGQLDEIGPGPWRSVLWRPGGELRHADLGIDALRPG